MQISLMVNRFFAEDAGQISRLTDDMNVDNIYFAVPIFTPHLKMMRFEPYRATMETFESIRRCLPKWGQNAEEILEKAQQNSVGRAEEKLLNTDLHSLWKKKQDIVHFQIRP